MIDYVTKLLQEQALLAGEIMSCQQVQRAGMAWPSEPRPVAVMAEDNGRVQTPDFPKGDVMPEPWIAPAPYWHRRSGQQETKRAGTDTEMWEISRYFERDARRF